MELEELFILWWLLGYVWKTMLELFEIMWQERKENGRFIFTLF